jgi:hypothetical protein
MSPVRRPALASRAPKLESLLGNRAFQNMVAIGGAASPRRCSCGGSCDKCSRDQSQIAETLARLPAPLRKSLESIGDDELEHFMAPSRHIEHDGQPHQGAATIVCDGSGGYRVQLNSWAGAKCGIEACVRKHEESHAADWRKRWPDGCKGKANGDQIPLGGPGYDAFLKKSECDAYTTEVPCEEAALSGASKECKPYVQGVLDDTKKQKKAYCGGGC